jgi:hypothetical protein
MRADGVKDRRNGATILGAMGRRTIAATIALASVLAVPGCGGGGSGGGGGDGGRSLVVASAVKHGYKPDPDVPRSYNSPLTAVINLSGNPAGARPWFVELYHHGEPIDHALANGLCAGMQQLKGFPASERAGNWREFLVGYIERFAPEVPHSTAEARVAETTNVWPLGTVSPADAAAYWKACRGAV